MKLKERFAYSTKGINYTEFRGMVKFERFFWPIIMVIALGSIIFGNDWSEYSIKGIILNIGLFGAAILLNVVPEFTKNKRHNWLVERIQNGCENIYTEEYYSFDEYLRSEGFLDDEKNNVKKIIRDNITYNIISGTMWIIIFPRIIGYEFRSDMYAYILGGTLMLKGILALIYAFLDFNTFVLKSKDILPIPHSEGDELMRRIKSETDSQMLNLFKALIVLLVIATIIFGKSILLVGVLIILMSYDSLYKTLRNGKVSKYLGV